MKIIIVGLFAVTSMAPYAFGRSAGDVAVYEQSAGSEWGHFDSSTKGAADSQTLVTRGNAVEELIISPIVTGGRITGTSLESPHFTSKALSMPAIAIGATFGNTPDRRTFANLRPTKDNPQAPILLYPIKSRTLSTLSTKTIIGAPAGISTTYLGYPYFPYMGSDWIPDGHLRVDCDTLGWSDGTDCLSINANQAILGHNEGNQGNFWDFVYRQKYSGQDGAGLFIHAQSPHPVALAQSIASTGTITATTPIGDVTLYTVTLSTALTSTQIAEIKPMMRIETDNSWFAYIVPRYLRTAAGTPVLPISADGKTLTVDAWSKHGAGCISPTGGCTQPIGAKILNIGMTHQIDDGYITGGFAQGDGNSTFMGWEFSFTNYHPSIAPFNPATVMQHANASDLMLGIFGGITGTAGGTAFALAASGWQAGYVADNPSNLQTNGPTYGFDCAQSGPDYCFYNTHKASAGVTSHLITSDPGNTGTPAYDVDVNGNMTTRGNIIGMGLTRLTKLDASMSSFAGRLPTPCKIGNFLNASSGLKPGETSGNGSGVPAICEAITHGGTTGAWYSMFTGAPLAY